MPSKLTVSGKCYQINTRNTAIDVDDLEGHQLGVSASVGVNFEGPFAGEYVTFFDTYDLVMGNGTFKGYGTHFHSNGDVYYYKYQGTMTTQMVDDKPVTTFEATWQIDGGTGEYKNAKGGGTSKGKAITPDVAFMEWEGEVTK